MLTSVGRMKSINSLILSLSSSQTLEFNYLPQSFVYFPPVLVHVYRANTNLMVGVVVTVSIEDGALNLWVNENAVGSERIR